MARRVLRVARRVARGPLSSAAVRVLERITPWPRGVLTVLTYHRVDTPEARPDLFPGLISASPEAFATQMRLVADHYDPVSMEQVLDALDRPTRLPSRAVLVTVDDAYADFLSNAWPIMRGVGVPATLFVPTALVGTRPSPFWWDRLWSALASSPHTSVDSPIGVIQAGTTTDAMTSIRRLRDWLKSMPHDAAMEAVDQLIDVLGVPLEPTAPAALDWLELRQLHADGVCLAPHTRLHPLLDRVTFDRAVAEITGSSADLEREIGATVPVLAYPSGAHGDPAAEAARASGMRLALTTQRGGNDLRSADRFRIRRINVGRDTGHPVVRAQLLWAAAIDARQRHRRAPG